MPTKSYDTKAAFDEDYYTPYRAPDGSYGGNYERWWLADANGAALRRIVAALALPAGSDIFVVGCGFGWGVEALYADGFNVWGDDTSAYIQSEKGNTNAKDGQPHSALPSRVLPYDVTTAAGRVNIQQATGVARWRCIITDHALDTLYDSEATALSTWVHANYLAAQGVLVHRVTVRTQWPDRPEWLGPPNLNVKADLAAWRALIPADLFFDGVGAA